MLLTSHVAAAVELAICREAKAFFEAGDYEAAIGKFSRCLDEESLTLRDRATTLNYRAHAYRLTGRLNEAHHEFHELDGLIPGDPRPYTGKGDVETDRGNPKWAVLYYSGAINADPNYEEALYKRGDAYLAMGHYEVALDDYDRAIRLNPRRASAYHNRGVVHAKMGQFDRAIADYDAALRLAPDRADAYGNRGFAYSQTGDLDRAIADFDEAIRLDPRYVDPYGHRGRAYYQLGQFDRAAADTEMARNLAPFDPYAAIWHYLATVRTSPNAREGLEFDTLSLDRPEWPRPLVEMLLGHMAPYKLWALAADDDAGRQETKRCEAAYYAGEAFELVGKSGDALLRYQKARRICPKTLIEYAAAQAGLERMRP